MLVRDMMSRRVDIVSPSTPLVTAARRMRDDNVGCLVVIENGDLVGVVTDRDLVVRPLAEGGSGYATVRDAMSAIVFCCSEETSEGEARRIMAENRVRRLPVIDAAGRVTGVISADDLEGGRPTTEPYRVTFYKRLSPSQGMARDVTIATIHVSPNHPREEVIDVAIRRFERERGGSPWNHLADGYQVEGPLGTSAA